MPVITSSVSGDLKDIIRIHSRSQHTSMSAAEKEVDVSEKVLEDVSG